MKKVLSLVISLVFVSGFLITLSAQESPFTVRLSEQSQTRQRVSGSPWSISSSVSSSHTPMLSGAGGTYHSISSSTIGFNTSIGVSVSALSSEGLAQEPTANLRKIGGGNSGSIDTPPNSDPDADPIGDIPWIAAILALAAITIRRRTKRA